jgi:hypothetical protein
MRMKMPKKKERKSRKIPKSKTSKIFLEQASSPKMEKMVKALMNQRLPDSILNTYYLQEWVAF